MSGQEVLKRLGNPDRIENDSDYPQETQWIYALDGAKCKVVLKSNRVRSRPACQTPERLEYLRDIAMFRDPPAVAKEKALLREKRLKEWDAKRFNRPLVDVDKPAQ